VGWGWAIANHGFYLCHVPKKRKKSDYEYAMPHAHAEMSEEGLGLSKKQEITGTWSDYAGHWWGKPARTPRIHR
jgi:hypothetical protein